MERISSRQNPYIRSLRALGTDSGERQRSGLFLCDGMKLLEEALAAKRRVRSILWKESAGEMEGLAAVQYLAAAELYDYASPMKNSPGPLFTVERPDWSPPESPRRLMVLEELQDPGNLGTVIRTASAFRVDAVILLGGCADLYHPRTVRSTMGAIFRQPCLAMCREELAAYLEEKDLPLYGAALSTRARDLRELSLARCAVAVGSEGHGLSRELLALCQEEILIPMAPESESLNAAVAAAVLMWEMGR